MEVDLEREEFGAIGRRWRDACLAEEGVGEFCLISSRIWVGSLRGSLKISITLP